MPGTMTLWCESGKHHWERAAQRGRPPRSCPQHATAKAKPSGRSREANNSLERMAELRVTKAQRQQERAELARVEEVQRKRNMAAKLPELDAEYQSAFEMACLVNTPEAWHRADVLQHRIISTRKAIA
jgi:hypothetical protein